MPKGNSNKKSNNKIQLNKVMEMIDYYKYYGNEASKEIKSNDIAFLSKQIVLLVSLLKEISDYELTTEKDTIETFKRIQSKIRKNVDFRIPKY